MKVDLRFFWGWRREIGRVDYLLAGSALMLVKYAIEPPHLDNYLVSRRGQFRLEPLPGGRTLLEGTTWYTSRMWPAAYWHLWSDHIIHTIHRRVLQHVAAQAEER